MKINNFKIGDWHFGKTTDNRWYGYIKGSDDGHGNEIDECSMSIIKVVYYLISQKYLSCE